MFAAVKPKQRIMKFFYKITGILLFIIVNSVQAWVKPGIAAKRSNGLQNRKLPEKGLF